MNIIKHKYGKRTVSLLLAVILALCPLQVRAADNKDVYKRQAWYTAGYKNSSKLRGKINEVESYAQLEALLEQWLAEEKHIFRQ